MAKASNFRFRKHASGIFLLFGKSSPELYLIGMLAFEDIEMFLSGVFSEVGILTSTGESKLERNKIASMIHLYIDDPKSYLEDSGLSEKAVRIFSEIGPVLMDDTGFYYEDF